MKARVMLLNLMNKDNEQFDLFNAPQSSNEKQKSDRLINTVDRINRRMGAKTIQLGGTRPNAAWNIKRDLLSKRYTTRWHELPSVK